MITVYLREEDPDSADIVERLEELVVAHQVIYLDGKGLEQIPDEAGSVRSALRALPRDAETGRVSSRAGNRGGMTAPTLVDGEAIVRGRENILEHLRMLEVFLGEWSKFQSDACYCDADGNVE